jgi:hypothetical protein
LPLASLRQAPVAVLYGRRDRRSSSILVDSSSGLVDSMRQPPAALL